METTSVLKTGIGIFCVLAFVSTSALGATWQAVRLVSFNSTNGSNPIGGLALGTDGNFYGTTSSGGAYGKGTVFKMTPGGALTTLLSFDGTNGASPQATLIQANNGNFYGTTGAVSAPNFGTVFMITPAGALTTIAFFHGTDGINPLAPLVQGNDGYLYGTTVLGGTGCGCGSVFKAPLQPGPVITVFSFGITNGSNPRGALVQGSDGYLYGMAEQGAPNLGCVFKISPTGQYTTLVSFTSATGSNPLGALVDGGDGFFYGSTYTMGPANAGTIFKITPSGVITILSSFGGGTLARGNDGSLYGASYSSVFSITPSGKVTTLVSLEADPSGPLLQAKNGCFYGTTSNGGATGNGSVFELIPPLTLGAPRTNIAAGCLITCSNVAGRTAVIESSSDLQNWSAIYTNAADLQFQDSVTAPYKFYRARLAQ